MPRIEKSGASSDGNPRTDLVRGFDPRYFLAQNYTLDQNLGKILSEDLSLMIPQIFKSEASLLAVLADDEIHNEMA